MNRTWFFLILFFSLLHPSLASSEEVDCRMCHGDLVKKAVVHSAVNMGCTVCHSAIDASVMPHKKTNTIKRGLSAEQPEICYGCHDKAQFTKKTVHLALGMGCTTCHDPHSSKYTKLLVSNVPASCFTCHDKAGFNKKTAHAPVAAGTCMACHTPHSSDEIALLTKKPLEACQACHGSVTHGRHVRRKGTEEPQDPERPGRPFYCGSCHNPHGSDSPVMFRFGAKSITDLCQHCHKIR